jgi:plasmid stabilization system protein ParE
MSYIKQTPRFRRDIERLREFLIEQQSYAAAQQAADVIEAALEKLTRFPEGFRPTPENPNIREMGIPFQARGYMLLYRYTASNDTVTLLAMKHQLENDYK